MPIEWIHIPLPGDHYSPGSGSSYATVIYELSKRHIAAGGRSRVVVGKGTIEGFPPYENGEVVEVDHRKYPDRNERVLDALVGGLGFNRPMKWRGYSAALDAIPLNFNGIVFVHGEPAIVLPIKAARPAARIVLYCHYELFNWYSSFEVRRIAKKADALIGISRHICQYVTRKAGQSLDNICLIPNGIDTDRFQPGQVKPQGDPIILYVGRVEPEKGAHLLIAACRRLKDRKVDFRLRIVGSKYLGPGTQPSAYHRQLMTDATCLGHQVEFIPFVDRNAIAELYQSSSIFCAPSIWNEPFGLTVVEAMASGVPVVLSQRGAFPDVAGEVGVYFDPPDDNELADRLEELLADPTRREALGKAGRSRAMHFSWDSIYKQLIDVLENRSEAGAI